jgi:hypothetical protein
MVVEKLFRVVFSSGDTVVPSVLSVHVPEDVTTLCFLVSVRQAVACNPGVPDDLTTSNMALFANLEAYAQRKGLVVSSHTKLRRLGEDEEDPLIVKVPRVCMSWWQRTLGLLWTAPGPLSRECSVEDLRGAVFNRSRAMLLGCHPSQFTVYQHKDGEPLARADKLAGLGGTKQTPLTAKWLQLQSC